MKKMLVNSGKWKPKSAALFSTLTLVISLNCISSSSAATLLLAAGGGGGAGWINAPGGGGQTTITGGNGSSSYGGAGGDGGGGGVGALGEGGPGGGGGGGGGWLGNAVPSDSYFLYSYEGGSGAPSFVGGPSASLFTGSGGFGGGGGGDAGGGGGGGYSGGGGGAFWGGGGGGGGSFINGMFSNTVANANFNGGYGAGDEINASQNGISGYVSINGKIFFSTLQIIDYVVPTTGLYEIIAVGAQGGSAAYGIGGSGAEVGGDITLIAGTDLRIVVGQGGGLGDPGDYWGFIGAGGGGGSFVYTGVPDVSTSVPEPSTWALMILGFGGLGFAAHRRNKSVVLAA